MKTLRLVLAGLVLFAACDSAGPSAPPLPAHSEGIQPKEPASDAPCDSACLAGRSPFLGGSGG